MVHYHFLFFSFFLIAIIIILISVSLLFLMLAIFCVNDINTDSVCRFISSFKLEFITETHFNLSYCLLNLLQIYFLSDSFVVLVIPLLSHLLFISFSNFIPFSVSQSLLYFVTRNPLFFQQLFTPLFFSPHSFT